MRKTVAIGFLGTTLDAGRGAARWQKWRPSISLCQHEDLLIDRFEILHNGQTQTLVDRVTDDLQQVSPETEVCCNPVELKDPWDFEEVYGVLHDFARTYPFNTDAEDYLIHITTGTHVAQICMFLLTESHHLPGRLIQLSPPRWGKGTAGDYRVIDLDLSRYDRIATRFRAEHLEATDFLKSGIATRNRAFNHMVDQIERIAIRSKTPILLTGPTGAGKSLLAKRIFELKKSRHQVEGAFVEVNCATLRGDAALSALFGHKRGAFTGAVSDRAGLLRTADNGVLFLDEIGELGQDEQAMILRAIEEKLFLPVGSDQEVGSNFQLLAGTNRDLGRAVTAGRFREDLFARLNLWTFELPGLKDRREDIEPNLDFELRRYTETNGQQITFNKEAREKYLKFATSAAASWSANFRDLSASITRMAILASGSRITEDIVQEEVARLQQIWRSASDVADDDVLLELLGARTVQEIDPFDRIQLTAVITACRQSNSLSAAGRTLFAASRKSRKSSNDADRLRKYLARFGLDWRKITAA